MLRKILNKIQKFESQKQIKVDKISEIKINGDNQKINIPKGLIKENQNNNVTIKTGRNLYKTTAIDYDDIEFTNLLLEIQ